MTEDKLKFDKSLTTAEATTPAEVLKEIKEKVDTLYDLKLANTKAEEAFKKAKNELSQLLEDSGVDKVIGSEASVSLQLKSSVTVPKDEKQKADLFKYIEDKHGKTVLHAMQTINAKSFSSWFGKEVEATVKETGKTEVDIVGIKPYEYYSLSLRKRAKK